MTLNARELVGVLVEKGAVLPLEVWSAGFQDVLDGVAQGGVPEGHRAPFNTYESAVEQYLYLISGDRQSGDDIVILKPDRIIDANGVQVYP